MRRPIVLSTALLALAQACNCSNTPGTTAAGPDPTVLDPVKQVGSEYVLDFGRLRAGKPYTREIAIENRGLSNWTLSAIALREGSSANLKLVDPPAMPAVVPSSETFRLKVEWRALQAETLQGFIDIDSDDAAQPRLTIKVLGEAVAPTIEVCVREPGGATPTCTAQVAPEPLTVDFGVIADTDPAVQRTLIIKNLATLSDDLVQLYLGSVDVAPGTSSEFKVGSLATQWVDPGGEVEVALSYKPVNGGWDEGTLEIVSDDPRTPVVRVRLRGGGRAPRLCVDPTGLDFGSVGVGTSDERELMISSCGVSPLELTAAVLDPNGSSSYAIPLPLQLPMTLAPGAYVKLRVRYSPAQVTSTADRGMVMVESNGGPARVSLSGNGVVGPTCDLDLAPRSLDFGSVPITGFADKVLFGTNKGQRTCNITSLTGPTGSAAFTLRSAPGLPYVVHPGATFTINLRYTPTGAGVRENAEFRVESDDPAEASIVIALTGQGKQPSACDIQVSPASLNFGVVPVGNAKASTVDLYNFGTGRCYLVDSALGASSAGFSITNKPGMIGFFFDSGAKAAFEVTFKPLTGGSFNSTLDIKVGSNPLNPPTVQVPLLGTAGDPGICITPQLLDFGVQAAATVKDLGVTIQSCGAGTLELRGINFEAGTSPTFKIIQKPPVPLNLTPGQSTTIQVRYAPKGAGPDYGRLLVLSNDSHQKAAAVALKGNADGCYTSILSCQPGALTFPRTETGQVSTMTFSCLSAGMNDVHVTGVRLRTGSSQYFRLSNRNLPPALEPGRVLRVAVDFESGAVGPATGIVEIVSDDCRAPLQTVQLSAEGKAPAYPACIAPKVFSPKTMWEFKPSNPLQNFYHVWHTPLVANLDDDNGDGRVDEDDIPNVIITTSEGLKMTPDPKDVDLSPPAALRALDGKTGAQVWAMTDPGLALNPGAQMAVGDIDGDNLVEIVGALRFESPGTGDSGMEGVYKVGRMVAFENDGTFKWVSDFWNRSDKEMEDSGGPEIVDLDADGVPEIVLGAAVYDPNGSMLWEGKAGYGGNGHGPLATTADLDGDGKMEVIGGNTAYAADGTVLWTFSDYDGLPIVIDVDLDRLPEIVLRYTANAIVVIDNTGHKKYGPFLLPEPDPVDQGEGQPPAPPSICSSPISAADFDGDLRPEIALAMGNYFAVFEPMTGEMIWRQPIQDYQGQCGAAGAAAFDFEGDGIWEAVYQDAENTFAFRGNDGTVIFKNPRSSLTIWDTPAIADVDNDGHADIVVVSEFGVKLLNNQSNDWVATRRIWNQHNFRITNVSESGAIPRVEPASWLKFNTFRANEPYCIPQ